MNMITKRAILLLLPVAALFAACNNEPPECTNDPFPPLRCELVQTSGKKIDTLIVRHLGLDSVLYPAAGWPHLVTLPLSISGDTSFVQFTIVSETQTVVERYSSIIGIASTPELCIENLDCGPVYRFTDLDYTLYSVKNYRLMSIDSIHYFSTDVGQDYETHAQIFF